MSVNRRNTWVRVGFILLLLGCGAGTAVSGFTGGAGTPADPYQIATPADLIAMGADNSLLDKQFVLVNDIDLDPNLPGGCVFTNALIAHDGDPSASVSTAQAFAGVLDGRGHAIRHLCIRAREGYDAGLFGSFAGLAKDLRLEDVCVSGSPCGALAGIGSQGTFLRCSVSGIVTGSNTLGGLVGKASQISLLRCQSRADVMGDTGSTAGGLVGSLSFGTPYSHVTECRAEGTVAGGIWAGGLIGDSMSAIVLRCCATGTVSADQAAGGLIGHGPYEGSVLDCYARGAVRGLVVGGLIGNLEDSGGNRSRVLNSYTACDLLAPSGSAASPVGSGLFGKNQWSLWVPTVLGCFWDKELPKALLVADPSPANYGAGLTTPQMQQADTFRQAGWDLDCTWTVPEKGYPVLRWEAAQEGAPK